MPSPDMGSMNPILKEIPDVPFKSEKQRRYLWKNNPSLARLWTEKYGSKVVRQKAYKKLKEHGSVSKR